MGCDIHQTIEFYSKEHNKWVGDSSGESFGSVHPRRYRLFSILADVRNYHKIKPIKDPVGWPDDISGTTKDLLITNDDYVYHSHTWYTLQELKDFDLYKKVEFYEHSRYNQEDLIHCSEDFSEVEGQTYKDYILYFARQDKTLLDVLFHENSLEFIEVVTTKFDLNDNEIRVLLRFDN